MSKHENLFLLLMWLIRSYCMGLFVLAKNSAKLTFKKIFIDFLKCFIALWEFKTESVQSQTLVQTTSYERLSALRIRLLQAGEGLVRKIRCWKFSYKVTRRKTFCASFSLFLETFPLANGVFPRIRGALILTRRTVFHFCLNEESLQG